mmetsp:Transcript_19956/g.41775  ORF Transcript_19956/g.41775 Transcript_19956/m.41775 type:complete len:752 (+) Transcript_19956:186-2441(+)
MKRPLPTTTTTTSSSLSLLSTHRVAVLTLLFLSNNNKFAIADKTTDSNNSNNSNSLTTTDIFDIEDLSRKKNYDYNKQCRPLLQMALNFDVNSSIGLNRDEFSNFWTNGLQSKREDVRSVYDALLCECHYSFDMDRRCCDDTASEDDDDGNGNDGNGSKSSKVEGHWSEISLVEFNDNSPGSWEKHYHKQFCKRVYDVLSWEGIYVNDVDWDAMPIMTTATSTTTTTTTEAPTTTSVEVTTTEETTTTVATTTEAAPIITTTEKPATTTEEPTTTVEPTTTAIAPTTTEEPEPIVTTPEATTTATASTAEATTAGTVAVADTTTDDVATTTAATTTTIASTEPTTTESSSTTPTTTIITDNEEPTSSIEPIIVTFVGSTDGNVDADTASQEFLDEVAHAFWKVSLNILEDMDIVDGDGDEEEVRNLQWVRKPQGQQQQGQERRRRQLISSLGDEFDTYFERMNMHVENVGCPAGLVYAAARTPCIQFKYTLIPLPEGPLTSSTYSSEFANQVTSATNDDGDLYNTLLETYPDTQIVGMGSPGRGIPYQEASNTNRVVSLESGRNNEAKSVASSGIAMGGLVGMILAFSLLIVLIAAFALKRHRTKQLARKEQELNDSNLSEDIEASEVNADASRVESWLDMSDTEENEREEIEERLRRQTSPASSLAAMGVASTVATRLSTSGNITEDNEEQQRATKQTELLMRQTSATPSTSSSLETMGVSNTVATRLTTGDTEVMLSERAPWSKNEPVV